MDRNVSPSEAESEEQQINLKKRRRKCVSIDTERRKKIKRSQSTLTKNTAEEIHKILQRTAIHVKQLQDEQLSTWGEIDEVRGKIEDFRQCHLDELQLIIEELSRQKIERERLKEFIKKEISNEDTEEFDNIEKQVTKESYLNDFNQFLENPKFNDFLNNKILQILENHIYGNENEEIDVIECENVDKIDKNILEDQNCFLDELDDVEMNNQSNNEESIESEEEESEEIDEIENIQQHNENENLTFDESDEIGQQDNECIEISESKSKSEEILTNQEENEKEIDFIDQETIFEENNQEKIEINSLEIENEEKIKEENLLLKNTVNKLEIRVNNLEKQLQDNNDEIQTVNMKMQRLQIRHLKELRDLKNQFAFLSEKIFFSSKPVPPYPFSSEEDYFSVSSTNDPHVESEIYSQGDMDQKSKVCPSPKISALIETPPEDEQEINRQKPKL